MELRNRKTGEIVDIEIRLLGTHPDRFVNSIAELNEEWEDYKEPKECYWVICDDGELARREVGAFMDENDCKRLGNYFETGEEAERAVEKLKAWKRLKDRGFEFTGFANGEHGVIYIKTNLHREEMDEDHVSQNSTEKTLDLLFGGEANERI